MIGKRLRRMAAWGMALLLVLGSVPARAAEEETEAWRSAEKFFSLATSAPMDQDTRDHILSLIREELGDSVYCNIYVNGEAGTDPELIQAVQDGTISMVQCATSSMGERIPELALLDIPFLFEGNEECNEALNEDLLNFFQPCFQQAGLQLLAWHCTGMRNMTCSFPVEGPEDLEKLKIRVLDSRYHQIFWQAVGAEAVSIPLANLFYSLQQNVVNAQENPFSKASMPQYARVQSCVILTRHIPFISHVVMNKAQYDALDPAWQEGLEAAFAGYYAGIVPGVTEKDMEDAFKQVLAPSEELMTAFAPGVEAVEKELRKDLGDEQVDAFLEILARRQE